MSGLKCVIGTGLLSLPLALRRRLAASPAVDLVPVVFGLAVRQA